LPRCNWIKSADEAETLCYMHLFAADKGHITYTFSYIFFLHIQVASAILPTCMDLADCGSVSYYHAAHVECFCALWSLLCELHLI